jgi:hypothetical protein
MSPEEEQFSRALQDAVLAIVNTIGNENATVLSNQTSNTAG